MTRIQHLLVATDLTERSERALSRALRLREQAGGCRLTLLHVVTHGLPGGLASRRQSEAQALLIERLAKVSDNPDLQAVVVTGDPFSAVIGEAVTRQVDVVVVGEPGKHRYSDMFIGTTAERIFRFSDRPVLMVKRASQDAYKRILVAFDGSEGAIRALHAALSIAPEAEFRVVHAWWPPHVALGDGDAARQAIGLENDHLKMLIERAAKEAVASAPSQPVKLQIDMVENNPYLVLRNESAWPDLLVMGTHSKARLATTVCVGRLARHMLAEVACDVLASRP